MVNKKYDKNRNINHIINTKLFTLESKELEMTKQSIKGGRVCPRIHQISSDDKFEENIDQDESMNHGKYVYLDISGMYVSIMRNEVMPYGKAQFCSKVELEAMQKMGQTFKQTHSWRTIYSKLTEKFGLFIA